MQNSQGLTQRVVYGGFWVFLSRISVQILNILKIIILARILTPYDFGILGIALLIIAILEVFSQTGFEAALVQKNEDIKPYLNSAWTILIIRGIVLFILLFFTSTYAASFFSSPSVKLITQAIAFTFLINSFTNIGLIYFQKELRFEKQFVYQFSGAIVDCFVSISLALILKNVWALIFGLLSGCITKVIVSYLIHSFRPAISFRVDEAKRLFRFGKWILGSGILKYLITHGDDIYVGKMLGVPMLGIYQMAYRFSNMPATEISHVISQVTFPTYSKMQDDLVRLKEAYLRVFNFSAFLSFPITGLIFTLGHDFTRIFLGGRWAPVVLPLQILAFEGLVRAVASTTGPVFLAMGKPKIITKWHVARLAILATLIYPLTMRWQLAGTSLAAFLCVFVSCIGLFFNVFQVTGLSKLVFVKILISLIFNTTLMVLLVFALKISLAPLGILKFVLLAFLGLISYISLVWIFDKYLKSGVFINFINLFKSLKVKN